LWDTDDDIEEFVAAAKKDNFERKARAAYLQSLRRDKLKLSQSELAKAVGANVRTLQGWETGRQDFPAYVEILMTLMKQVPDIKRMLMRSNPLMNGKVALPAMRKKGILKSKPRSQSSKKSAQPQCLSEIHDFLNRDSNFPRSYWFIKSRGHFLIGCLTFLGQLRDRRGLEACQASSCSAFFTMCAHTSSLISFPATAQSQQRFLHVAKVF